MAIMIRKNDTVQVMNGKYGGRLKADVGQPNKRVGRRGRVLSVDRAKGMAVVEGVNVAKKHQRANPRKNIQGGRIEKLMPMPLCNLRLVCPACGPVRARLARNRTETTTGGRTTVERVCVKCGHHFG